MGKTENYFSTFLVCCIVGFFGGLLLTALGFWIVGLLLTVGSVFVGIFGFFVFFAGHKVAQKKTASGPRTRVASKIHSAWRTHKGKVIAPEEIVDDPIHYHIVLITEDNKRLECDTHYAVFHECIEGAWGYAEVQGEWLGGFTRDADLYTKHSTRP